MERGVGSVSRANYAQKRSQVARSCDWSTGTKVAAVDRRRADNGWSRWSSLLSILAAAHCAGRIVNGQKVKRSPDHLIILPVIARPLMRKFRTLNINVQRRACRLQNNARSVAAAAAAIGEVCRMHACMADGACAGVQILHEGRLPEGMFAMHKQHNPTSRRQSSRNDVQGSRHKVIIREASDLHRERASISPIPSSSSSSPEHTKTMMKPHGLEHRADSSLTLQHVTDGRSG
nr:hypothetical protein CFP56_68112 [Quercus suber]